VTARSNGCCPSRVRAEGSVRAAAGAAWAERAAHLVEHVFPLDVPVRQRVLSVPHRLRYRLAYDHRLCRTVLMVDTSSIRDT
jgi:hypothetical protein